MDMGFNNCNYSQTCRAKDWQRQAGA